MELAARLHGDARAADERRLLVLAGDPDRSRERAQTALDRADIDHSRTCYVGADAPLACASIDHRSAGSLLGTTLAALVLDCHQRCDPNTIGRLVGTVEGGGLLILLTPPLDDWPDRRDRFDESIAVPPFETSDVTGRFRERLVDTLRSHRGIAIVDVDSGTIERDGLTRQPPRIPQFEYDDPTVTQDGPGSRSTPDSTGRAGAERRFPDRAYEACLTDDQRKALRVFERLRKDGQALVLEADRGRGKSSVAGLAAGALAMEGQDVLVTAPQFQSVRDLFARAATLVEETADSTDDVGAEEGGKATSGAALERPSTAADPPQRIETDAGAVRFARPAAATDLPGDPDRVIVDEAAALPVHVLSAFLDTDAVAFVTTVHGYEGTGRGFAVRFRDHLAESAFAVTDVTLSEPIRYAAGDPIEVWAFRALALGARPPVAPIVGDATADSVEYRQVDKDELLADESLLQEVFGLLVLAHYRTEPADLARLLDAPNISVHGLFENGHPVSVALLAREGGLSPARRSSIYEGAAVRGNLIPDLLASQLRDEAAAGAVGYRVLRITTHSGARSRGLGSALLAQIRASCERDGGLETGPSPATEDEPTPDPVDWLGVGFGATPPLLSFWAENGFAAIHLGTSREDRSGEHSAIMLDGLSERGREVQDRHSAWFSRRFPGTLTDSLAAVDPDIVRRVCRSIETTPALALDRFEWRVAAGIPFGGAIFETAPRPVQRLAYRHLVDPAADVLSTREERLLVVRALQCRDWETAADRLGYLTVTTCKRALGEAVERLVELYGTDQALAERERFR